MKLLVWVFIRDVRKVDVVLVRELWVGGCLGENGMRGRSEMEITYERQFSGRLVPRTGFDEYGAQFYGSSKRNTYYPVRGSNMMTGEHGLVGETSTNIWSSASLSTHCHGTSGSVSWVSFWPRRSTRRRRSVLTNASSSLLCHGLMTELTGASSAMFRRATFAMSIC